MTEAILRLWFFKANNERTGSRQITDYQILEKGAISPAHLVKVGIVYRYLCCYRANSRQLVFYSSPHFSMQLHALK